MVQYHKLRNLEYFSGKVCIRASVQSSILKLSFQIYCLLLELRRISITKLYCSNTCKNIQHFNNIQTQEGKEIKYWYLYGKGHKKVGSINVSLETG